MEAFHRFSILRKLFATRIILANFFGFQNANLTQHLEKVREDIEALIPSATFSGPAVIDWESWRPSFALNWGARTIYRALSIKDAKGREPHLTDREARRRGRNLFNDFARYPLQLI